MDQLMGEGGGGVGVEVVGAVGQRGRSHGLVR